MLAIAAREADIVGINPNLRSGVMSRDSARDSMAAAVDRKVEHVRQVAGERFDEIELGIFSYAVVVTDDKRSMTELIASSFGVEPADVDAMPYVLVGTAAQIADDLRGHRERWGTSYFTVMSDALESFAPVVAELSGT